MKYSDQLKHPKWQKKRLEILNRDDFTCQKCGDTETELHIHHLKYKGAKPWETPNKNLVTLCKHCHKVIGLVEKYDIDNILDFDFENVKLYKCGSHESDVIVFIYNIDKCAMFILHENNDIIYFHVFREEIPEIIKVFKDALI